MGARGGGAKLLFVGDIHLGRRPARLPEHLAELGLSPHELTPAAAWARTVELAREGGAEAVVLAGDVVDSPDDRFEAYAPLASGVRELVAAGIPVLAVAGNHDVEALPRLADQIPEFTLLGRGGRWETRTLRGRSGTPVRLLGWSFPRRVVHENPLASLRVESAPGIATLGVLHCDWGGAGGGPDRAGKSPYAPVPRAAFADAPADAWLLGHVHQPSDLTGRRPVGYLGSLVGLDPGEPGPRGPWWVEVDGPGAVRAEPVPLAPLRWEREDVPLDALESDGPLDDEDLADALFAALRAGLERVHARLRAGDALAHARLVRCRLRLVGHTAGHRALRLLADPGSDDGSSSGGWGWPREHWDGVHYTVEKVVDEAAPVLDLPRLAEGSDPAALCARRLLDLERGGEEADRLVRGATEELRRAASGRSFVPLGAPDLAPERVRELLCHAATRTLEDLLEQREGAT
ncbi:MAG: metallophosphoesterase [Proteobacteria bacterium]|nr:metallophosphoesterase [Pseudomonadota bacterium]